MQSATAETKQSRPYTGFKATVPKAINSDELFIFFVGNLIPSSIAETNEGWTRGGIVRRDIQTLSHTNGYVERLKIVSMRTAYAAQAPSFVHPELRKHLPNVVQMEDENGVRMVGIDRAGNYDGMKRIPMYPEQEFPRLGTENMGFVKMPVADEQQKQLAERFLHSGGVDIYSLTIPQLQAHFEALEAKAREAEQQFYIGVAAAAVQSAKLYKAWGETELRSKNDQYDRYKVKGWPFSYGPQCELLFKQLNFTRSDKLIETQEGKLDKMADAMSRRETADARRIELENERLELDIAERKSRLEEMGGMKVPAKAETTASGQQTNAEGDSDPAKDAEFGEFGRCRAIATSGNQCQKKATSEKGSCETPAHIRQMEEAAPKS